MKPFIFPTYVFLLFAAASSFPQIQHKCWIWNSSCLTTQAQAAVRNFILGIPELGVKPLDPMSIDFVHIDQDGLSVDLRNIKVNGLKNVVIKRISADMYSRVMRMVFFTDFSTKSQYTASGSLFNLPVFGNGDFSLEYANVEWELIMPFEIIKDAYGRDVLDLKGYSYSFDLQGVGRYLLTNLYNGDKISSGRMHELLNQNSKYVTERYGSFVHDKINDQIFNAIRTYLRSQPLENIAFY